MWSIAVGCAGREAWDQCPKLAAGCKFAKAFTAEGTAANDLAVGDSKRKFPPARRVEVALMALSMDEQRILDEIERGLASADPALATRMASFGAPRRIAALRVRRMRLVASLMTLVVVAMASVLVYALVPFRTAADRHAGSKASSSPAQPVMSTPSHAAQSPARQSQPSLSRRRRPRQPAPGPRARRPRALPSAVRRPRVRRAAGRRAPGPAPRPAQPHISRRRAHPPSSPARRAAFTRPVVSSPGPWSAGAVSSRARTAAGTAPVPRGSSWPAGTRR